MTVSLIIFLVLRTALDFLAELGYKASFCICLCNNTKIQKGRDLILLWRNQNATLAAQYRFSTGLPLHLSLKGVIPFIFGSPFIFRERKEVYTEGKGILRNCPLHEKVNQI